MESLGGGGGVGACTSVASATALQRNVTMLLRRIPVSLGGEGREGLDQTGARIPRIYDVVQVAACRREIWMRELLAVFRFPLLRRVVLVQDLHRAFRPHDGDLRRRPSHVVVPPHVLRVHDVVGAAVRLARDHRELGHGGFAIGEQQLGPCLMMPPCSWATPGRNPGTSSKVTRGMLKASQNRMNRAPFRDALMSSTPASTAG